MAHWIQAMSLGYIDEKTGRRATAEQIDQGLDALVDNYPDRHFIILEDYPGAQHFGASLFARQERFGKPVTATIARRAHEQANAHVDTLLARLAERRNVRTVNIDNVYCDAETCSAMENGRSLYRDADHVSLLGAMKAVPFFEDLLADL